MQDPVSLGHTAEVISSDGPKRPSSVARPVSAHDVACDELRQMILRGEYLPGGRIVQETVAAHLGVSVIPVREALKSLQGEGLVTFRPRRGFFVTEFSRDALIEICAIRSALEGMAVRQAIDRLDDGVFRAMAGALADMRAADEAADVLAFIRADRRLHFSLFERAGMPQLVRLITSMWDQSDHYRAAFLADPAHRHANHGEHEAIVEAARDRDTERLVGLLDEHRLGAVAAVDRMLESATEVAARS